MSNPGIIQLPIWNSANVQVEGADGKISSQAIPYLPQAQFNTLIQQVQQKLAAVAGTGGAPANIYGPLNLNGQPITGVSTSSPPAADEALSYSSAQGLFEAFGAVQKPTATYTTATTDGMILASGTFTVTLPTKGMQVNQEIKVMNIGGGTITVSCSAGINGGTTASLATGFNGKTFKWSGQKYYAF